MTQKTFVLRLPASLYNHIKLKADERFISVNSLILQLVVDHLPGAAAASKPTAKPVAAPSAPDAAHSSRAPRRRIDEHALSPAALALLDGMDDD